MLFFWAKGPSVLPGQGNALVSKVHHTGIPARRANRSPNTIPDPLFHILYSLTYVQNWRSSIR